MSPAEAGTSRVRSASARPLATLLLAHALSGVGNMVTLVALPLYVLAQTGSPTMAGVLAVAATAPVILGGLFGGTLVDRVGYRRTSVTSDLVGGVTVVAIPVLHATVGLPFGVLLALVVATGLLDTPGQAARTALLPEAAAAAGVPLERALGWWGAAERGAIMVGAPLAGVLVAWWGPLPVLVVDAASFVVSALVVARGVPRGFGPAPFSPPTVDERGPAPVDAGAGYWQDLRAGLRALWGNRLLRAVTLMVLATNAFDVGRSAVIAPVYAQRELGGAAALGMLVGASGLGALVGALVFSVVGPRLPRRATYTVAFVLAGPPFFFVLAARPGLTVCLVAAVLAGLAAGSINPIINAVVLEQVPATMRARVSGAIGAGAWAAMPVGSLAAGLLVEHAGLVPTLLGVGSAYLLVTLAPLVGRTWRGLDRPPADPSVTTAAPTTGAEPTTVLG